MTHMAGISNEAVEVSCNGYYKMLWQDTVLIIFALLASVITGKAKTRQQNKIEEKAVDWNSEKNMKGRAA